MCPVPSIHKTVNELNVHCVWKAERHQLLHLVVMCFVGSALRIGAGTNQSAPYVDKQLH